MYAVIDAETTGLSPESDRIIELAVIGVTPEGEKEWEWCSLINPKRNTGNGFAVLAHQIYPEDVENAPTFDAFACEIGEMLKDRAIIAHNALFDLGILACEYQRLGQSLPAVLRICTAQIAKQAGIRPYKLEACCQAFNINMDGMHHALADARATARLARALIDFSDPSWRRDVETRLKQCPGWPKLPVSGIQPVTRRIMPVRRKAGATNAGVLGSGDAAHRVAGMDSRPAVETLSIDSDSLESRYLSAVEWVLEDREISEEQQQALQSLRKELQLTGEQVRSIHMSFIRGLAGSMWRDGVISEHEQFDLDIVGELLELSAGDVEYARDNPIGLGLVNEDYVLSAGHGYTVCNAHELTRTGIPIVVSHMGRARKRHRLDENCWPGLSEIRTAGSGLHAATFLITVPQHPTAAPRTHGLRCRPAGNRQ